MSTRTYVKPIKPDLGGFFADYFDKAWPHRFSGTAIVQDIHGGVPSDPKVVEGWIRSKFLDNDERIRDAVASVMVERKIEADEAMSALVETAKLNGFYRDDDGILYVPGRYLKACLKEAVSCAVNAGKLSPKGLGTTTKTMMSGAHEHIMVVDNKISLGVSAPDGVMLKFTHNFRGSSICNEEYITEAKINFTVIADWDLAEKDWAMIWLTAQEQGLGASRSQGFGRFTVTDWTKLK